MSENPPQTAQKEPLFNVPPVTFGLAALLLGVHAIRLISPSWDETLVRALCFIPAFFSVHPVASAYRILSYTLLHFGWLHLCMNVGGLLAFGAGVENLFGKRVLALILIAGSIAGVLTHWALFPHSMVPLGGISAGLSALFGVLTPFMARDKKSRLRLIGIFVLINIAVGMMGVPDQPDASIAWQAHLGGYAFGIIAGFYLIRRIRRKHAMAQMAQH